jgi:hypothetical protein
MIAIIKIIDFILNIPYILITSVYMTLSGLYAMNVLKKRGSVDREHFRLYLREKGFAHYHKTFGKRYLLSIIIWIIIYIGVK